jgi:two-component system cell cycle sensor histidine kinase/response regulator CckA
MISEKPLPSPESLLEGSADGFALLDMDCVPVYVNPAALRLMGLICPEPGAFLDSISPADRDNVKAACVSALAAEGHSFHVDFRAARRRPDPLDAADRPATAKAAARVEAHVKLHRDQGGGSWILLNLREMRQVPRKARIGKMVSGTAHAEPGAAPQILPGQSRARPSASAEELAAELASKSGLLDMLLDNLPVMACRLDRDGVFLESRGAALRRIGQEDNEAVGRNLGLEWPECRLLLEKVLAGEPAHFEHEYEGARKRVHEMWFMPNPADGGAIGFGVDITERKRAEDELSKSEAFNRRVVESSRDGIMVLDPEGKLLSISQGGRKLMEIDEPEIFLNRSWLDFWRGEDRAVAENALRVSLDGGVGKFQGYCPSLTGKPKWWDVLVTPILNPLSESEYLLAICRDITESKRFEESLRRSKEQLEAILRSISDAVVVADAGGRVVYANDAAARMLGMPSSQELLDVALEDLALSLAARDESGMTVAWPSPPQDDKKAAPGGVLRLPPRSGEPERWVVANTVSVKDAEGRISLVIASAYDFTERKRAEEALHRSEDQLRQSQKMEAVGRLAGGVAHDFNNLLTAINGYSELLMKSMRESDPLRGTVGEISRAGDRAASLTRQLLTLSRRQVLSKRILDVNQVVAEIRQMLGRLIGEDIKLTTLADPALPTVMADPGQMEQLILNLALNARDAMPTGGRLTIETALARMDKGDAGTVFAIEPGDYVRLTVTDTGIGMDEKVMAHLFEPFFTTKPPGKGTGLGLSTVYGILKTAGGNIAVSSEPSKGTRISVYLPAGAPAAAPESGDVPARPAAKAPSSGESRETILLVEDEDMVRRLIGQVVLSHGYNLLEAGSGAAALEVVERNPGAIDLLLTDVVMAGMSGRELSERLAIIRPGLKVLYMSGYTDDAVLRHGVQQSSTAFLCKPFSPTVLIRKIREVIDGVPSGAELHPVESSL